MVDLNTMVRAFKICFGEWNVSLSIQEVEEDQKIKIMDRQKDIQTVSMRRKSALIILPGNIVVERKDGVSDFTKLYDVQKIEFHADWSGIDNPGYHKLTYGELMSGDWRSTMGGENAVANLIGSDSSIIYSFSFPCVGTGAIVKNIIKEIKLTQNKSGEPHADRIIQDELTSILQEMRCLPSASSEPYARIIKRIERLVTR